MTALLLLMASVPDTSILVTIFLSIPPYSTKLVPSLLELTVMIKPSQPSDNSAAPAHFCALSLLLSMACDAAAMVASVPSGLGRAEVIVITVLGTVARFQLTL